MGREGIDMILFVKLALVSYATQSFMLFRLSKRWQGKKSILLVKTLEETVHFMWE